MRRFLKRPVPAIALIALLGTVCWLTVPNSDAGPQEKLKTQPVDVSKLPIIEPKKHENYSETIPGPNDTKLKFDMVAIPGGTYLMGSPKDEKGRGEDEGPQHPVTVKPFWMGKCEVTWYEFDAFWKSGPPGKKNEKAKKLKFGDAITRPTPAYADETFGHGRKDHPVLCITHHAAMEYCSWLSEKTGKVYRLPTEAEWEWACRAGTTTPWSWGDDPKKVADYTIYVDNSDEITAPVGQKKPNPWGLYDMHGNLSEWCLDHYKKDGYSIFPTDASTIQPVLLPTHTRFSHVSRGGSWADTAEGMRSAKRLASNPKWLRLDPQVPQSIWWLTSAEFVGFRVVRAVEEQDNLKNLRSKVTRDSSDY